MQIPRPLDASELTTFLKERPYAVVHLDAKWDGCRGVVQERMMSLATPENEDVAFGYIDIDQNQEYTRGIGLANVPACSYYRNGELVATVIGMQQDIATNLRIIRDGGQPDRSNRISRL